MITVYHNPRCRKSREALAFLEKENQDFEVIKYLDEPLSKVQLESLLEKLKLEPIDLVRTQEQIWKTGYRDKNLSKSQLVDIMLEHPKLMERPIVVNGDKAVLGRPAEKILEIL
ncbi:MAG: arsenate reductase (glutaredoxin) [Bacteroidota bacterium]